MTTQARKILVTNSLPYANGDLHFGHVLEFVQTDIWARFQRLRGNTCIYICGDDAHGTPIMMKAEKDGLTPEQLIEKIHASHTADLKGFHISVDNFYTTHSEENKAFAENIYNAIQKDILKKTISQFYDTEKKMFLADRYIKGDCPKCKTPDQYGDNCEACGATYTPEDLKNPRSSLSGTTPEMRDSEHYFFNLPNYQEKLKIWLQEGHAQQEVQNKLQEWFSSKLLPWDISRDAPYFGFKIPNTQDKYFYVWLDAPMGYMASFQNWCSRSGVDFNEYWNPDSTAELYHFLGKDVMYFHALFWPAILMAAKMRTPTGIHVHGFLTINGVKMSKSRGTFINARTYLKHLDAEYLRYYFAAKLGDSVDDIDLNFDDFVARVNSDLVGKVINIASRCAGFIAKLFDHQLADHLDNPDLQNECAAAADKIANDYECNRYNTAIRDIMTLADKANAYVAEKAPWSLAKDPAKLSEVQAVCTQALNLFRLIMIYLKPVIPTIAEKSEQFLNVAPFTWSDLQKPLLNHRIKKFEPMLTRVDPEKIDAIINDSKT